MQSKIGWVTATPSFCRENKLPQDRLTTEFSEQYNEQSVGNLKLQFDLTVAPHRNKLINTLDRSLSLS